MNSISWLLAVFSASILCKADVDDPTLVRLPEGKIRGQALLSPKNNVYYTFRDVPYAAPPIGELRFKEPTAPNSWDGELNTTINSKVCYQSGSYINLPSLLETEDCLYLNVYTPVMPGDVSETPLPVLFWIHGGGFQSGSGPFPFYKPGLFIDHGIIVVTINYRLGALGFLTTEDGVIPGNIGLKDQRFAIQWVKRNINLFGGDPKKLVISGQSAGAASVALQLISKRNKGLFRGAILESGTALCQWSHQNFARFYAFELGRSLDANFTSDDSQDLLTLLRSLPASDINNNTITAALGKETGLIEGGGGIWLPVIEDENLNGALLTGLFHEDIRTGNINQVPILIGFNSEEQISLMNTDPITPETRAIYLDSDLRNLIRNKFNMTGINKWVAGWLLRRIYTGGSFQDDLGAIVKFFSDESFTTPVIRHAELQSRYTDVFLYQLSYKGRMGGFMDVEVAGVQGVGHSEELAYIWDTRYPPVIPDDPADLLTRERLVALWANFVKYLNPTPVEDSLLGNVTWKTVTPSTYRYLDINGTLEMKINPKKYRKWELIIDSFAIPPLANY